MTSAKPTSQHQWLQKFVGQWTFEIEMPGAADAAKHVGTESCRSIGGLWIISEGTAAMPNGSPATTILTLGYDPAAGQFVGTWIGSMMTYHWVYTHGTLSGNTLTLECTGPNAEGNGNATPFKDIIEFVNDDHRTLTGTMLGEDGQWKKVMTAHYRRVK